MAFDPRNILVIDFGQLGDVVMSLPALRAIRERFPHAQITIAVGKPGKELLSLSGYANEILEVDRVALRDGPTLISIGRIVKLVSEVRKKKFDFVIDLHSYYETNILGFLSGAPHRLYSRRSNRSLDFLANFKPQPAKEVETTHLIDRYLDLLKPLGDPKKVADFYELVALQHGQLTRQGDRNQSATMAEINGVALSTAQGWITKARERGLLPPGRRGRAG